MTCRGWIATLLLLNVAGCSRATPPPGSAAGADSGLSFEFLDQDTSGLSRGDSLLTEFVPYRDAQGVLRARGRMRLPDGARLQLTLYQPGHAEMLARAQIRVAGGGFDSPPLAGPQGNPPAGAYRFELVAYFDSRWQPAPVLAATDSGRTLRGPGIVRGQDGITAFIHTEDQRL